MSRSTSAVVIVAALLSGSIASADMSRTVISAFAGQFVISKDELPEGKNDRDTITKIKGAQLKELVGNAVSEDNTAWHFHYTAFLTRTGASALKLDFLKEGGSLSADKQLSDVDPKRSVLSGDISIDENEGLTKGKSYSIELLAGTTVVAKTTITFK